MKKEIIILIFFILVFIGVRSVNFIYHLNFTVDQAQQATRALELYRKKELTLIGNEVTSYNYQGKTIFQGPATHYMILALLILGNFDPVFSSYIFLLFCAFMIFPLYYGTKMLINQKAALIMVILYTLMPYFVTYTRFLWNPNFQLSLLPILILLMGLYKKRKKTWLFFALSTFLGILLHFHYQFIFVIVAVFIYYFFVVRLSRINILVFLGGLIAGLGPLILFELKHNFYNFRTGLLILEHPQESHRAGGVSTPHYYLSPVFLGLLAIMGLCSWLLSKLLKKYHISLGNMQFMLFAAILALFLFVRTAFINFPRPSHSFWAGTTYYNYLIDHKIYEIAKQENLKNYNIANPTYDTLALVPKYLLKRDNVQLNYEDYYSNKFLYVIYESDQYMHDPAYEVHTFTPSKLIKKWRLNQRYSLYLLERM